MKPPANVPSKPAQRPQANVPRRRQPPGASGPPRTPPDRTPPHRTPPDRTPSQPPSAQRAAGGRRFGVLVALTVLSTAAVAGIAALNSSLLDVDAVMVVGAERAAEADIATASGIQVGQPLYKVDLDAASRGVERVSWVGTAAVRRSWSGRIEIAVTERGPVIALQAAGGFAMVDHWGRQLEVSPERPEGFLPIIGIEASGKPGELAPPEAAAVLYLLEAMVPAVERHVTEVRRTGDELVLQLDVGGRATLGDDTDFEHKVQALETILERVDLACLSEIDVAVPSAPTVRRSDDAIPGSDEQAETSGEQDPNGSAGDC